MIIDRVNWDTRNAREALAGETLTIESLTVTARPEGSAAEAVDDAVTFDVPGWYVLAAGSERLRVLVFSAAALAAVETASRLRMQSPRTTTQLRMILRQLANHGQMTGGNTADLGGKRLEDFGA